MLSERNADNCPGIQPLISLILFWAAFLYSLHIRNHERLLIHQMSYPSDVLVRHFKFMNRKRHRCSPAVTHANSFNPSNVGKCSPTYAIAKKIPSAAGLSPDADGIASINTIQFKCQMSFDFWSKSPFIQKSVRAAFASPLAEIPCQMHQHPHPSHNNPGVSDILR